MDKYEQNKYRAYSPFMERFHPLRTTIGRIVGLGETRAYKRKDSSKLLFLPCRMRRILCAELYEIQMVRGEISQ